MVDGHAGVLFREHFCKQRHRVVAFLLVRTLELVLYFGQHSKRYRWTDVIEFVDEIILLFQDDLTLVAAKDQNRIGESLDIRFQGAGVPDKERLGNLVDIPSLQLIVCW